MPRRALRGDKPSSECGATTYQNFSVNLFHASRVNLRSLTILVTKDITGAKRLATELSEFLMDKEGLNAQEVEKKVLIAFPGDKQIGSSLSLNEVFSRTGMPLIL